MERVRIGCSGWNYRHWRDRFDPKGMPVRACFNNDIDVDAIQDAQTLKAMVRQAMR